MKYAYEVQGTAARGQTWAANGVVESLRPGDFIPMVDRVMREAFMQLTEGKAVYGQPGVGCEGPYHFARLLIEASKES